MKLLLVVFVFLIAITSYSQNYPKPNKIISLSEKELLKFATIEKDTFDNSTTYSLYEKVDGILYFVVIKKSNAILSISSTDETPYSELLFKSEHIAVTSIKELFPFDKGLALDLIKLPRKFRNALLDTNTIFRLQPGALTFNVDDKIKSFLLVSFRLLDIHKKGIK